MDKQKIDKTIDKAADKTKHVKIGRASCRERV